MPQKISKNTYLSKQSGTALMAGVIVVTILLLIATVVGFLALNNKQGPVLEADPLTIKADDKLTQGSSNNELAIDTKIIIAGLARDQEQRDAAAKVLADQVLPVGDGVTASTTVEDTRLSQLQTEFIAESDRRLKILNDASGPANRLTPTQRTDVLKLLGDEQTALTGLKAKAAAEATKELFLADRDELDKEYSNYIVVLSQIRMLLWANDQLALDNKVNVLGGKFQDRLNDASNNGSSVAKAQTALNTYQTSKVLATDATNSAAKAIIAVKPGSYESNRAVLKTYFGQLSTAHNEIDKATVAAQELVVQARGFRQ